MTSRHEHAVAILLAAGSGSRFGAGTHKLLATFRGRPLFQHALDSVMSANFSRVIVVTGAVELELPNEVLNVHNADWSSGQLSSLRAGLASATGADLAVIGLADQPFVTAEAWTSVSSSTRNIAIATYDGVRGHPVGIAAHLWDAALSSSHHDDEGLRSFMRLHPELVEEVPCKGSPIDIDTPEDLEQWT